MIDDSPVLTIRRTMTFDLASSLDVLTRTPPALSTLLAGLDDEWTRRNEGGTSFSAFDVVGHLIDGEETDWVPRARIILAGNEGSFETFDRFTHRERNVGRTIDELLDEFSALRRANIATVRDWNLSDAQLALRGRHPELGPATLAQLLATWVVHDLGHVAQIARVMAKRYAEDVGPWKDYVPVLGDRSPRA